MERIRLAVLPLLAVLICCKAEKTLSQAQEQLLLVVEVTRHGAREPSKLFNFTTNPDENFKHLGNITAFGRKQQFNLGKYIKEKYME